jgi:hypothetical protein fulcA4_13182
MDYRVTKYESHKLKKIKISKNILIRKIREKHPRAHNFYSLVRSEYKNEFMEVYNNKCAYCGVSLDLIPKRMFEIDHFVNEKSARFKNGCRRNKNGMSNLVLSCYDCNRKKTNFNIDKQIEYILHGDYEKVKNIFHRNQKDYSIEIGNIAIFTTIQQDIIRDFYNTLMLGNYIHRLDYLLMSMRALADRLSSCKEMTSNEYSTLLHCIDILQRKRNRF